MFKIMSPMNSYEHLTGSTMPFVFQPTTVADGDSAAGAFFFGQNKGCSSLTREMIAKVTGTYFRPVACGRSQLKRGGTYN